MAEFAAVLQLSSLDGSNGFQINGESDGDTSGFSVASAGDVNGDGFDDLIIGATGFNPSGFRDGASYVVFGKASGFGAALELTGLDGTNGFRVNGDVNAQTARSVASAGDVNGDGFDDVIVGTYGSNSYVVFGKSSGFDADLDHASLDGSNGFRINREASDQSWGSVASAGDINGDGFDDLVIGADRSSPNAPLSGAGFVVFGKAAGFTDEFELSDLDGSNGFRINGEATYELLGHSVASAGDVNGDGFDDIIFGAYDSNVSHVVFGKASGFDAVMDISNLDGSNGFHINGEGRSGRSVASAGDVNGDGLDDLIIGAYSAGPNGGHSGASYVLFGKASNFHADLELSALDGANGFQINGEAAMDQSGRSVASAGDVNGDGFDDLIIGAKYADPNGSYSGASYLVFGKASGFDAELELSSLDGTNGFQINGEAEGDRSGFSVASGGDVNGDGFDDLIVGAPRAGPNGERSGASYVIYGRAPDAAVERIGSAADQAIRGGAFDDLLSGLDGDDSLIGSDGHDTLIGGEGDDNLRGGRGSDTANYADAANAVTVDLADSAQQDTGHGLDLLWAMENLTGSDFDDLLTGNGKANLLIGGDGDDTLTGGLWGDELTGGAGADRFVFTQVEDSSRRRDTITDLEDADVIDISAIDPKAPPEVIGASGALFDIDQTFTMIDGRFTGRAGEARVTYNGRHDMTYLQLDSDGDGMADFVLKIMGDHRDFEGFVL